MEHENIRLLLSQTHTNSGDFISSVKIQLKVGGTTTLNPLGCEAKNGINMCIYADMSEY